jgi:hypothetical protein
MSDPTRELTIKLELVVKITSDEWVSQKTLDSVPADVVETAVIDAIRIDSYSDFIPGDHDGNTFYVHDVVRADLLP